MENEKKRCSVTAALMWRITALALGIWLCLMCCITYMCAWDVYRQYLYGFRYCVNSLDEYFHYDYVVDNEKERIQHDVFRRRVRFNTNERFPFTNMLVGDQLNEYAIVCYDKQDDEGNWVTPCFVEDRNIMYFYFEVPGSEAYTYGHGGYAYIDMDETQFGRCSRKQAAIYASCSRSVQE